MATYKHYLYALLSAVIFLVAGCGGDDIVNGDDDDDNSSNAASVKVSGAIEGDYSGTATFVSVLGISRLITIALEDNEGTAVISLLGVSDEGTFSLAESNGTEVSLEVILDDIAALENTQGVGNAIFRQGTVSISSLGDNRISGSFDASGEASFGGHEFDAEGEFVATCEDILGIVC